MNTPPPQSPQESIPLYGFFNRQSPEGRRFHRRNCGVVVAFVIATVLWTYLGRHFDWAPLDPVNQILPHFLFGATYSYYAWALWKYVGELDELARSIQLQAIFLTYLTGLAGVSFFSLLRDPADAHMNYVYFIILEFVRAFWLWIIARRYQ
jgi:hypothetical protein